MSVTFEPKALNTSANHQLAEHQAGADGLTEAHIVGEQRHRQPPTKREEIPHLVLERFEPIAPVQPGFDVLGLVDDDGLGKAPLQGREVEYWKVLERIKIVRVKG